LPAYLAQTLLPGIFEMSSMQINKEIRALYTLSGTLSARDIFLEGLERHATATSNLEIRQDLSAFNKISLNETPSGNHHADETSLPFQSAMSYCR
jgi:hypothetical protein